MTTINTLPAQVIDSSTPLRIRVDSNSATIEEQFTMFKEIIESKVAALIAKFSEQIENIRNSKQELCKFESEVTSCYT
jgi:wobble nucleotide-excising tRNase